MIRLKIGIVIAVVWCGLFAIVETTSGQSVWKWNFASPVGGTNVASLNEFAEEVSGKTQGAFQIQLFPNGQLGSSVEIKQQLQSGAMQLGEIPLGQMESEANIFGIDAIPFSARNANEARRLYKTTRSSIEKTLNQHGLSILLAMPSTPQRMLVRRAPNSTSDARDMTWRISDAATKKFADSLGARSASVPFKEIAEGFTSGRFDIAIAQATPGNTEIMEAVPYICTTTVRIPKNYVLINQKAFQELPAEKQKILRDAAGAIEAKGWAQWNEAELENRKQILARSGRTCELTPAVEIYFQAISKRLLAEYCPQCSGPICVYPETVCSDNSEMCCPIK